MGVLPVSAILPVRGADSVAAAGRDYFKEIGIKPFINAAAAYSALGGRNMWPAVVEAMEYARKRNVIMKEMQDAVGKRIASMIGCEAAMVTSGATAAMTLGTAACLTGNNEELIRRVPDLRGMKNEVIIQKAHRYSYDHGVRNCGISFVEVNTIRDVEKAANQKTAMLFFCKMMESHGDIKLKEYAALGKAHNIPTLIDGSNTVPPLEGLSGYLNAGFDLAAFSGGKGLRGPYSAGFLLGRKDLVEAARMNNSPNSDTIGRGMKVSKEEILGMLAAVEYSLQFDYSVEMKRESRLVKIISGKVSSIPGIRTEVVHPPSEGGRPHLRLHWNKSDIPLSVEEARSRLEEGEPSIRTCYLGLSDGEFEIGTAMLKEEEIDVLVRRVRKVLSGGT